MTNPRPNQAAKPSIVHLEKQVGQLPPSEQERFRRIFHLVTTEGRLVPPPEMQAWIESHFGSVAAVETQTIVKVTNLITMEGALFNGLRAQRPMEAREATDVQQTIADAEGGPFCHPETGTPADTFGRRSGQHGITASNVAKYDGHHGLVIFNEHNPLEFTVEQVQDYLRTAISWARGAHHGDQDARYFFFMWNCLWKSGASILHGHAQMTLTRGMHYAGVEAWRRAALLYRLAHGDNYFDDLFQVHQALGLGFRTHTGIRVLSYLSPIKEKEILLIGELPNDDMGEAIYQALQTYVARLGVLSFNLALYMQPINSVEEDWTEFPAIVRIVDRGDPMNRTADVGAMELYGSSVISSDPFRVAQVLRQGFSVD
jgi:galactose-1-phosphate uridylyltransferase